MMNDWYHDGWGSGTWVTMALMMLAFWAVIAVLVVYAVRTLGHRPAPGEPSDEARRILDARLARGEIDAEEYNHRRELLRSP
jgi:putative membrane protein